MRRLGVSEGIETCQFCSLRWSWRNLFLWKAQTCFINNWIRIAFDADVWTINRANVIKTNCNYFGIFFRICLTGYCCLCLFCKELSRRQWEARPWLFAEMPPGPGRLHHQNKALLKFYEKMFLSVMANAFPFTGRIVEALLGDYWDSWEWNTSLNYPPRFDVRAGIWGFGEGTEIFKLRRSPKALGNLSTATLLMINPLKTISATRFHSQ